MGLLHNCTATATAATATSSAAPVMAAAAAATGASLSCPQWRPAHVALLSPAAAGKGMVQGKRRSPGQRRLWVSQEVGRSSGSSWVLRASGERGSKSGLSIGDRLLDFIEGGPKLRKWYGAPDLMPRDGKLPDSLDGDDGFETPSPSPATESEVEEDDPVGGDAVLVSDGDSETGQMVVLSLILKRKKIRVLVKDEEAMATAFGPYTEPVAGTVADTQAVSRALKGVSSVVITGQVGVLPSLAQARGVQHVVLLSQVGASGRNAPSGIGALFGDGGQREAARKAEAAVAAAGVPYTVVRTGRLRDEPSGAGVVFGQGDELRGTLAREDAAAVCVAALDSPPESGGRVFEVVNSGEPDDSADSAWQAQIRALSTS